MLPPALARGDVKKRSSEVQLRAGACYSRRHTAQSRLGLSPLPSPALNSRCPASTLSTDWSSQPRHMVEGGSCCDIKSLLVCGCRGFTFCACSMADRCVARRFLRTIFRTPAAPSFPPSFSSGRGWTADYGQPGLMTRQGSVERKCRHDACLFGSTSGDPGRIQCRRFACAGFQGRENVRSGPSAPRVDREQSSGPSCNLTRGKEGKREERE